MLVMGDASESAVHSSSSGPLRRGAPYAGFVQIAVERTGGAVLLRVVGDLDLASADELRESAAAALASPGCTRLIVDLADVRFMDSTGLGALVDLRNHSLARHVRLVLGAPSDRVLEVLRLTAMEAVFDIAPDDGARQHVGA
jgi:anti-sigma B factor antagonist